jgi:hypothetical protein
MQAAKQHAGMRQALQFWNIFDEYSMQVHAFRGCFAWRDALCQLV